MLSFLFYFVQNNLEFHFFFIIVVLIIKLINWLLDGIVISGLTYIHLPMKREEYYIENNHNPSIGVDFYSF